jgi:hypothetical protein
MPPRVIVSLQLLEEYALTQIKAGEGDTKQWVLLVPIRISVPILRSSVAGLAVVTTGPHGGVLARGQWPRLALRV